MDTKSYNFKQVSVSYGGRLLTGFAEGDAVTVEPDNDAWSLSTGADGESTRSKSNNRSATVTIRLMQGSDSNDVLSGFALADDASGAGALPLFVKDNSGRSLHASEKAWIQKLPTSTYGAESGEREWVIRCGEMVHNIGGNN